MKERQLITSFLGANMTDVISTKIGLGLGLVTEAGFSAEEINSNGLADAAIAKIALVLVMVGAYALSAQQESRLTYPLKKTMQMTHLLIWGIQLWNVANIGLEVLNKLNS